MNDYEIEQLIAQIGFRDFIPIDKTKRDGKIRTARTSFMGDVNYSVTLLFENDGWIVENVLCDDLELKTFMKSMDLPDLLHWLQING